VHRLSAFLEIDTTDELQAPILNLEDTDSSVKMEHNESLVLSFPVHIHDLACDTLTCRILHSHEVEILLSCNCMVVFIRALNSATFYAGHNHFLVERVE
jgi:hypothetical protein